MVKNSSRKSFITSLASYTKQLALKHLNKIPQLKEASIHVKHNLLHHVSL